MSTAIGAQATYGGGLPQGAPFSGYVMPSVPASSQPGASQAYGGDSIRSLDLQTEAAIAAPIASTGAFSKNSPLMSIVQSNEDADAKRNAHIKALQWVAIIAGVLGVTSLFAIPAIFELVKARAKANANILREGIEHSLRDAERSAGEPALEWVRKWEKTRVDPRASERIAAGMRRAWAHFKDTDQHFNDVYSKYFVKRQEYDDNTRIEPDLIEAFKKRKQAIAGLRDRDVPIVVESKDRSLAEKIHPIEIPETYRELTKAHVEVAIPKDITPEQSFLGPEGLAYALGAYRTSILSLKHAGVMDGDVHRLAHANTELLLQELRGNHRPLVRKLAEIHGRSASHLRECEGKLLSLHQQAAKSFVRDAR